MSKIIQYVWREDLTKEETKEILEALETSRFILAELTSAFSYHISTGDLLNILEAHTHLQTATNEASKIISKYVLSSDTEKEKMI